MRYKGLDEVNRKILEYLTEDSRMSYAELARKIHLSRVAVRERISNMIKEGIICQFTTVVNASKVGFPVPAFLDIEVQPDKIQEVIKQLQEKEAIKTIYQKTGSAGVQAHAFLESTEKLNKFLQEEVYVINGIEDVDCQLLLRCFKSDLTIKI